MNLLELVQRQTEHPEWGSFAGTVATQGPTPRQGTKSDEAHPPIHPTKCVSNLSGNVFFDHKQSSTPVHVQILLNM